MNVSRKFPQSRLRRTRLTSSIRSLVAENGLSVDDLIQPIFVKEDLDGIEGIDSLPGINRFGLNALDKEIEKIQNNKIKAVAIFPVINPEKKDDQGSESLNEDNLVCTAIKQIKKNSELAVIADVALDPYTSHGHDGVLDENGYVENDKSLSLLIEQALTLAQAGADMVAPSDMMDGRVLEIRQALEENKFYNTKILSYAAKYASNFYGPFRDAIDSRKNLSESSKETYQMDFANITEASLEIKLDINEGADMVIIKPGLPYLDIVSKIKKEFSVPVFSYHVSGEYSMIKSAALKKYIDEESSVLEAMYCFKRAGCNAVLTYYIPEIIKWLNKN